MVLECRVNGRPVRFFRSPMGGADWPWHAFGDLLEAVGYSDDKRAMLVEEWAQLHPEEARRIMLPEGQITIVSHRAAKVLFTWLAANDWLVEEDYYSFWRPAAMLFAAQTRNLTDAEFATVLDIAGNRFEGVFGNA